MELFDYLALLAVEVQQQHQQCK